ncbi:uncharacterized protein LOC110862122 isoform X1 [Folsomia candida]|uniref:uncharacterized protein LOC110862122 isoform X1 n=1 Tax=Folsomia candida TaxID=158441 RepID=UPI001604ABEF|nr:uncharacterized protein LOC110862122 isoform X1 [Folsomia candida]
MNLPFIRIIAAMVLVSMENSHLAVEAVDNHPANETRDLNWWFCCNQLTQKVDSLQNQFNSLIPSGFIYTQYPGQADPTTLFPTYTWTDVTTEYAGQFFRAEGGNSATFGTPQAESSPKITTISWGNAAPGTTWPTSIQIADGVSPHMFVSTGGDGPVDGISVTATGYATEVRPVNQAIRIWKRV